MRRSSLLVVLYHQPCLVLVPTASAAPTWLGAVPVSGPADAADDGEVAFSPQGDLTIVFDGSDGARRPAPRAVFRAAGGSFGAEQTISDVRSGCPGVRLPWTSRETRSPSGSAPTAAFSRVQAAFRTAEWKLRGSQDSLRSAAGRFIAADRFRPSGNAIAIWTRSDGADERTQFWSARGGSFGSAQTIFGCGFDAGEAQVAFDPAGNALAVWQSFDGGEERSRPARGRRREEASARHGRFRMRAATRANPKPRSIRRATRSWPGIATTAPSTARRRPSVRPEEASRPQRRSPSRAWPARTPATFRRRSTSRATRS